MIRCKLIMRKIQSHLFLWVPEWIIKTWSKSLKSYIEISYIMYITWTILYFLYPTKLSVYVGICTSSPTTVCLESILTKKKHIQFGYWYSFCMYHILSAQIKLKPNKNIQFVSEFNGSTYVTLKGNQNF